MNTTTRVYKIKTSNYPNLNYLRLSNDQRVFYYELTPSIFRYIALPSGLVLKKRGGEIFFSSTSLSKKKVRSFLNYFIYWLKVSSRKLVKRFILKGLGFRFFSNDSNKICFKIGFSHIIELKVPDALSFTIPERNKLCLFGYDLSTLGNFYKRIRKLKLPNVYTGKGILLKNEKLSLKPIKKN